MQSTRVFVIAAVALALGLSSVAVRAQQEKRPDNTPPEGFVALFNGKDLTNWKGLLKGPNDNPIKRAALSKYRQAASYDVITLPLTSLTDE